MTQENSARERILGRVKAGLGRQGQSAQGLAAARQDVAARIAARPEGPRPPLGEDLVARFVTMAEGQSSTIDRVVTFAEAPSAVARYLAERGLPANGVVWPALSGLPWSASALEVESRKVTGDDRLGITSCFCAVAETGSLMVCSSPDTPSSTSLLPETHVALVPLSRLVPSMEEAWKLLREEFGELPRAVNFISGPSRTGDIEQTIVLGAHGPYRVHIVLVEAE